MTSLICLIQRCNLRDGRLIRENESFTCGDAEAEILIRGGIAKEVEKPTLTLPVEKQEAVKARIVEKQEPEPEPEPEPYSAPEPTTYPPEPQPAEKVYAKRKGKR